MRSAVTRFGGVVHDDGSLLWLKAEPVPATQPSMRRAGTPAFDAARPFAIAHTDHGTVEDRPGIPDRRAAGTILALAEHGRLPSPAVPAR